MQFGEKVGDKIYVFNVWFLFHFILFWYMINWLILNNSSLKQSELSAEDEIKCRPNHILQQKTKCKQFCCSKTESKQKTAPIFRKVRKIGTEVGTNGN